MAIRSALAAEERSIFPIGHPTLAIEGLPLAGAVSALLLLVLGLVLWAAGRRALQPALAALGGAIGFAAGWMVAGQTDGLLGAPPWLVGLAGALLLACIGAIAFRFAVAGALAIVLALVAPAVVLTVHLVRTEGAWAAGAGASDGGAAAGVAADDEGADPAAAIEESIRAQFDRLARERLDEAWDKASAWLRERAPIAGDGGASAPDASAGFTLPDEGRDVAADGAREEPAGAESFALPEVAAPAWWDDTPPDVRRVVILASMCGLLAGALLGTLAHAASAVVVTAFGGAALWIGSARFLLTAALPSAGAGVWPASASGNLVMWLVVSILGIAIQWTFRPRPADKPR
jgi:hypothetical protein